MSGVPAGVCVTCRRLLCAAHNPVVSRTSAYERVRTPGHSLIPFPARAGAVHTVSVVLCVACLARDVPPSVCLSVQLSVFCVRSSSSSSSSSSSFASSSSSSSFAEYTQRSRVSTVSLLSREVSTLASVGR